MSWRDEEKALKSKGELPSWQSIDKYTIFYQEMLDKYEDYKGIGEQEADK